MASGIDLLHTLPRFGGTADAAFKPGLERMHALLDAMDRPHEAFRSVHVAGTNGKGSTASMIAAIATSSGINTGLHTSPELMHVTDLMRVDGTPAPAGWLDEAVERFTSVIQAVEPSFFEATVALSFLHFAERGVDLAVVEVGLGGRLDATNVLSPDVCVITSIDLEHTALLGDTLAAIAREKAGIIKPGTPCITGVHQPEAVAVIREVADAQNAPLHHLADEVSIHLPAGDGSAAPFDLQTPERTYRELQPALPGAHQRGNAALAVREAELAVPSLRDTAVREGLATVRERAGLRGRMEVLQRTPLVVTDVAHNPSSLEATLAAFRDLTGGRRTVGLALARDKDHAAIANLLHQEALATVIPLQVDAERLLPPNALRDTLATKGLDVAPAQTPTEALALFLDSADRNDGLLLTGSHYVVRDILSSRSR